MRHAVGLAEPNLFQLDSLRELVEQPTVPSEQDIDQVDSDLVHEPAARNCWSMLAPMSPIRLWAATTTLP